jgi:hypothetical protein
MDRATQLAASRELGHFEFHPGPSRHANSPSRARAIGPVPDEWGSTVDFRRSGRSTHLSSSQLANAVPPRLSLGDLPDHEWLEKREPLTRIFVGVDAALVEACLHRKVPIEIDVE